MYSKLTIAENKKMYQDYKKYGTRMSFEQFKQLREVSNATTM